MLDEHALVVATLITSTDDYQGHGDFDELNFNIEDLNVPREDAVIFATKLIDGDGISLIVRSEASFIRPERAKFTVTGLSESVCA